jgi:hypothetical protein
VRRQAALALPIAALALCSVPAIAQQAAPPGTVNLSPSVARQHPTLSIDARPTSGSGVNEAPSSIVLELPRGLRVDRQAPRKLCSPAQASNSRCPTASGIGRGFVDATVAGYLQPGGSFDLIGGIEAFLEAPVQPGDIAGMVLQVTESISNQRGSLIGRIVPVRGGGPFGVEIRFDGLPGGLPYQGAVATLTSPGAPLAGITVTIKRLRLTILSVSRAVRLKGRRGGIRRFATHFFLANPPICKGAWPYEMRAAFPSGPRTQSGRIRCRRRSRK